MDSDITSDGRSFAATEVAEQLRGIETRLATAWVEGDRSFIEHILAEDWSVIDLTGRILRKAEVLEEAFGSKERKIVSMHIDDLSVRSYRTWAIVTGRTQAAGEYQGVVSQVTLRFTDVFAYRDGEWRVIASQATLVS